MSTKQKSTEQLNLRIPKELLEDLEQISKILKVNKSEWIKIKIGEIIHNEKSKIIEQLIALKEKGLIDKKEIDKLLK
jgi:hypothetical protein